MDNTAKMENKVTSFGGSTNKDTNHDGDLPLELGITLDRKNLLRESFPADFKFGMGGSAVQIEGGWNADGKGPSVWDTLCIEHPEAIEDGSTCFVTCDSYNQWKEDVQLLTQLGCNSYKFSLSWSRILPNGDLSVVNQSGIDYYNQLIDALLQAGIEPLVVLWHFDLPTALAQKFTWKDEGLIPHFVNYAQLCFEEFGDRVKLWMTINEPWVHVVASYDLALHPPKLSEPEAVYIALHNLILAHAQIYRLYQQEFRNKQNGQVGISLDSFGLEPATDSAEDEAATQISFEFRFGIVASPLIFGKYPDCVRERVDRNSKLEGREKSRLPVITPELSALLKGTVDFIGLNYYSCEKVSVTQAAMPEGVARVVFSSSDKLGFYGDTGNYHFHDPAWGGSSVWWLKVTPPALRSLLNRIRTTYGNPEILISENGFPDKIERVEDHDRLNYLQAHLNETLKAIKLDGCNVTGYYAWSLLDGWEWTTGHSCTFGVFHVDRTHPDKIRTPRWSAKALEIIYKNRGFESFE